MTCSRTRRTTASRSCSSRIGLATETAARRMTVTQSCTEGNEYAEGVGQLSPSRKITPKALVNFSPRETNAEGVGQLSPSRQITPKAFANSAQGSSAARTLGGTKSQNTRNPERVRLKDKPFQGFLVFINLIPGLSLRSNPGLKLANAFGVNLNRPWRI